MLWWTLRKMKSANAAERAQAATALQDSKDPRAVDALIAALRDPDSRVRIGATIALSRIRDPRSADALMETLHDEAGNARAFAAQTLGAMRHAPALDRLLAMGGDESWAVRMTVAMALGDMGDRRAVDLLTVMLFDDRPEVCEKAVLALTKVDDSWLNEPGAALVVPNIEKALDKSKSTQMRAFLIDILGQIGDRSLTESLLKRAMQDPEAEVRAAAQKALLKVKKR